MANIYPIGSAILGDFYGIAGSGIPLDAQIAFTCEGITAKVTPDVVRPHFVSVAQLPLSIHPGLNTVGLEASGWSSESVSVLVLTELPLVVRALYTGRPVAHPYTIAFVGNPALTDQSGAVITDPIIANMIGYQNTVEFCVQCLLNFTEDILRASDWDAEIRIVSIFDRTASATTENSLARQLPPNIIAPIRDNASAFLAKHNENADIIFVISDPGTFGRASAYGTTDSNVGGNAFTYDTGTHRHRPFPSKPGTIAIPLSVNTLGITPIHEFGHASSSYNNGYLDDIYHDGNSLTFLINKKFRGAVGDAIPTGFAIYNGEGYNTDLTRDGIGYPASWLSYQPELIDAATPNIMDNYWVAANPHECRLDRLAYLWLRDRLKAKIFRV